MSVNTKSQREQLAKAEFERLRVVAENAESQARADEELATIAGERLKELMQDPELLIAGERALGYLVKIRDAGRQSRAAANEAAEKYHNAQNGYYELGVMP